MSATGSRCLLAAVCLLAALLPTASAGAVVSQAEIDQTVTAGATWLRGKQVQSGAIGGFNGDWATTTLAAAGINAADVRGPGTLGSLQDNWALEYTEPQWAQLPSPVGPGQIGKAILISYSAGLQPTRISAEVSLAAALASTYDWSDGSFADSKATNAIGFALLAMPHLGLPASIVDRAVQDVLANQHPDGGWTYEGAGGTPGDTDMTGAALAMVCSNGVVATDSRVQAGLDFLHDRLDPATGAIESDIGIVPAQNAPTHAWALTGLRACGEDPQSPGWTTAQAKNPIDFALSLRVTSGGQAGAIRYELGATATDPRNVNATEGLVRALTGSLFSADPPPRADPSQPAVRLAPVVPAGTLVPVTLTIDDGASAARMCAVRVPSGAPLNQALGTARMSAAPAGCVDDLATNGPWVTRINGASATAPSGGWVASAPGAPEHRVGGQPVGFGDVVRLRLEQGPLPGALHADAARLDFGSIGVGTTLTRSVSLTAAFVPVRVEGVAVSGAPAFAVVGDGCGGRTLAAGESCTVEVRYRPGAPGADAGMLRFSAPAADTPTIEVQLVGAAVASPKPRVTVRGGLRRVNRKGIAVIAKLSCPAAGPCQVKLPRKVWLKIAGKRYRAAVLAPARLRAGASATVRVRLSKRALAALAGRRATVRVKVEILASSGSVSRTIKATLAAAPGRASQRPRSG